jgi:hypothetical protein
MMIETLFWKGDSDTTLADARKSGCVLSLWFQLAQAREQRRAEFASWLQKMHAKYGARFGRCAA